MGKRTMVLWIAAIIVAGGVIAGVVIARSGGYQKPTNTSTTNTQSSGSAQSSGSGQTSSQAVAANKVDIRNFAFSPASIRIKVGTTVTWTNNDAVAHTVTADNGNGPNSGNLDPGKSYSFTYTSAGTFTYHCNIHPNMTGTVQVSK